MRAAALFGVFALAKILVLWGATVPVSPWTPLAYLWQDAAVALALAALHRCPRIAWAAYGILVLYAAINVPIARVMSTPMTATMFRAARGTLADSITVYVTWTNVGLILLVAGAGAGLPWLLRRVPPKPLLIAGVLAVALGPVATRFVETRGLHRNAAAALAASMFPRISSREAVEDWRRSPFDSAAAEDLSRYRGAARGRNVVLVLLESTGARHLKPYGAAVDPMPNLTRLAEEAILFENATCVYPESIKGLFSVLCSTWPAIDMPPEALARMRTPSIAEMLSAAGYRTGLFHSGRFMYLGMESVVRDRGFDALEDAGDIGGNRNSSFGVDEQAAVTRILGWLDEGKAPFFVAYLPIAGHHPYDSAGGPFAEEDDLGRYRNSLHEGDAALGRLIEGLRERGAYENTLFVVMGDHGEAFGEREGNFGHTLQVFEENVHVPFLIAAPGLTRRERVQRTASLIDTAPTIFDLLGLKVPPAYQGATLLDGPERMALFYTDYSLGYLGLRDGRWKFIHELDSDRSKLFDLSADPLEARDVSARHAERSLAYRDLLKRWASAQRAHLAVSR